MKEKYENPQITIINIENSDVITTSGEIDFNEIPGGGK